MTRSFGDNIYTGTININEGEMDQSNLLENMVEFNDKSRPKTKEGKNKKRKNESANALYEGKNLNSNAFKSRIFPIKSTQAKGIKILTLKQMLQRLSTALAQVKAGNTSERN